MSNEEKNTKAEFPQIKGFQTSTDYDHLWELINLGFRIPAWIINDKFNCTDLVEVKRRFVYMIGTRGIGYEGFGDNIEDFKLLCESLKLLFVEPSKIIKN